MKILKNGFALLLLLVCGMVNAASYVSPMLDKVDASPKYMPTKTTAYDDTYHIAGASWSNDRAIASEETDREPSSIDAPKEVPMEPKPWLHKYETDQPH
jgi:hypothetical protein